jgi:mRNA interferase MazF
MATTRRIRTAEETSYPKRGEIYLASLDPSVGREIKKTRPVLVIQNDVSNRLTGMTIVAPITSTVRFLLNPVHVLIPADNRTRLAITSVALLNQVRAIDRIRLLKKLGVVDHETVERLDEAIKISLGLVPV